MCSRAARPASAVSALAAQHAGSPVSLAATAGSLPQEGARLSLTIVAVRLLGTNPALHHTNAYAPPAPPKPPHPPAPTPHPPCVGRWPQHPVRWHADGHALRHPDAYPAYLRFLSHDMMPAMRERQELLQPLRADAAALLALLAADPEVCCGGGGLWRVRKKGGRGARMAGMAAAPGTGAVGSAYFCWRRGASRHGVGGMGRSLTMPAHFWVASAVVGRFESDAAGS